jgi:DNA-binding CsgD family transcriptional regulator
MTVTEVTRSVSAVESLAGPASAEERLNPDGDAIRAVPVLSASSQPVRGRDAELTAIGEHLDQLRSGAGTVALIEGAAGMGKSRLLKEVARMARRLSIRVGIGEADRCDSEVQLSTLLEALFDGSLPILGRAGLLNAQTSPEQRYWLLQDLEALLERAALKAPVLVCLDDLQWADSGTAAALRSLPTHLATVPVAWVLAYRPGLGSADIRNATDQLKRNGAETIVLRPFDEVRVAQLAADVLQAEPGSALLKMAERAGGNPFLLAELLSGLREEQLVRIESGRAELVDSRLPHRVSESLHRQLELMSDSARQVATVAAALGRGFSLSDLTVMLDLSPSALLAPIEELINADMLVERGDKLYFWCDLIFEAVRASVPLPVRRALDRQAAMVMLAAGACPVEVATQLATSANLGDEVAITTLFQAAEALGTTDPGAAADLSQRALKLVPRRHALRGPLMAETAVWLHAAARGKEAKAFADAALRDVLRPAQEAEVRLSLAGMFAMSPDVRAEAGRQALAVPGVPINLRARHLAILFHNLVTAGRLKEARATLAPAKKAVQRCHDVAGQFVLELAEAGLAYADGRFGPALELVEAALRTSLGVSDDTRRHLARQWRFDVLTALDRLDESLPMLADDAAAARRDRQRWALAMFETGLGRQLLQVGRLSEAAAVLAKHFTADAAHQVVSTLDAAGIVAFGRVGLHTGDRSQARLATEVAHLMLDQSAPSVRRHAAWLLARQSMADGDALGAHRWLCALGEAERMSILPLFPMDVTDDAWLVRIALAAQDHELAVSAVASAQRRSAMNPDVRSLAAAAAHADGLLRHSQKRLADAVEHFDAGPRPLALASALEDLGVVTAGNGDTQQAVAAFNRALELYVDAGATWDAGRVRGRLRALGVRRRLVSARRQGRGWAAMTDAELAVARLVAQGMSNREVAERLFVSPHTVSGHLRHVFAKLDVNSRVELTRLAGLREAHP